MKVPQLTDKESTMIELSDQEIRRGYSQTQPSPKLSTYKATSRLNVSTFFKVCETVLLSFTGN